MSHHQKQDPVTGATSGEPIVAGAGAKTTLDPDNSVHTSQLTSTVKANFDAAVKATKEGKVARRESWTEKNSFIKQTPDGKLVYHDNKPYIPPTHDQNATDWQITHANTISQDGKYHAGKDSDPSKS
jgi:hypothetical protein